MERRINLECFSRRSLGKGCKKKILWEWKRFSDEEDRGGVSGVVYSRTTDVAESKAIPRRIRFLKGEKTSQNGGGRNTNSYGGNRD